MRGNILLLLIDDMVKNRSFKDIYIQNKCKYAAVNKYELKYHVKRVHNKKQKSYHCDKCESVFEDRLQLKAHLKKVHLNEKPYKCSECKRQFSTKRIIHISFPDIGQRKSYFLSFYAYL